MNTITTRATQSTNRNRQAQNEMERMKGMNIEAIRKLVIIVALAVLMASGASAARADEPMPVIVEQSTVTGNTTDDGDEYFPPTINPNNYYIYVSGPGNGAVGGIAYADEDVLRYEPSAGTWTMMLDGTAAGLPAPADIDALVVKRIDLGHTLYLSFDNPVAVPGLGTVDDSDVVTYTRVLLNTPVWALAFDGSAHGLTTSAEDIDGLALGPGGLEFSTLGGFSVPGTQGGTLKGADEDVFGFNIYSAAYGLILDGTSIGMAGDNDIRGIAFYTDYNDRFRFFSMQRAVTLGTTANYSYSGDANDILVQQEPLAGPRRYGLFWDASAAGFPKVDAFDVTNKY